MPEQLFAVFAGFETLKLIGRQAIRVHATHIAMAARAAFGDFSLGIRPLETRDIVGGFAGHAGITSVAIGAG
jgi:hypothetical protein